MLSAFQEALVALATDPTQRARLRTEGPASLEGSSLDAAERRALAAVPVDALERFARSLVAKRWQEVLRVTPLTWRVAPELARIYRGWAERHPGSAADGVLPPGPGEALRALTALREELSTPRHSEYAADLLAFEVLAACSRADRVERRLASRWHLADIAADVSRGLLPIDPPDNATLFRFGGEGARWRPHS